MSKSLWNGTDPIDMIDKYWTDALRLTLSIWNTPWNDLKFDEYNVENNMFFVNKLWNASRFVWTNLENIETNINKLEKDIILNYDSLMFHEKWILSRIKHLSDLVTDSMEKYDFSEAWQELQVFTKNEFCDYYIEEFKLTKDKSEYCNQVITYVLNKLLKLWHPYIPFVTEEIHNKLWFTWDLISSEWWIVWIERNLEIEKDNKLILDIIKEIRSIRADNNIMPNKTIWLQIYAKNKNAEVIWEVLELIAWIVKAETFELIDKKNTDNSLAYAVIKAGVEVYIDTSNAMDIEVEIERLKKQITNSKEYIAILDKKLLNESFVNRAPEKLVRLEMEKKEQERKKLEKLEGKLLQLKQ